MTEPTDQWAHAAGQHPPPDIPFFPDKRVRIVLARARDGDEHAVLGLHDGDLIEVVQLLTEHIERRIHKLQEVPPWMRSARTDAKNELLLRCQPT